MHEGDGPGRSPPIKWRDLLFWIIISIILVLSLYVPWILKRIKISPDTEYWRWVEHFGWLTAFDCVLLTPFEHFPPQSLLITKYIPSIVKTVQLSVIQEEFIVPTSNTYALLCQIDTTTLIDRIPCWLLVVFYLDSSPIESLISDLLSKYLLDSTQSTFNIFTDCFYDWCVCFVYVFVYVSMCLLWQNMSVRQLKGWEIYAECYFHKSQHMLRWFQVPGPVVWLKHNEKHVTKAVQLAVVRRQRGKTAERRS